MSDRNVLTLMLCVAGIVLISAGFMLGAKLTDAQWRQRSVGVGKAEYYMTTNGVVEWRWKW